MTETPPVHVPHHGGSNLTGSLGHKLGPLPVWVWGLIGGLAFGAVYYVHKKRADALAQAQSTQNSGSAFTSLGSSSNGGNAGELATTGGASGLGGGTGGTLAQWAANAVNWLIGNGTNPSDASNALSAYINGSTLTGQQATLVNQALANFGAPPTGILPVNTGSGNTSDPNSLASTFVSYTRDDSTDSIFGVKADGSQVHLTPSQWAAITSQNPQAGTGLGRFQSVPGTILDNQPAATTPAAIPAPSTPAVVPVRGPATSRVYITQAGDTYFGLAQRFYGNGNLSGKIEAANPYPARSIPIGASLNIPN